MIPIKYRILFVSVFMSGLCFSQEVDYKLGEIRVQANLQSYYQDDTHREELDSLLIGNFSFLNLGEALQAQGGIMISSYGSRGSLAGIKIRGTGDNHTMFHWNGIPVNSLTTGTMDASLIPAGFMQNIAITKGASGVLAGNASFGGAVYLNNEANWSKKYDVTISSEMGSFGYRALMPSFLISSGKIQYRISFQKIKAENGFPFKDPYKQGAPEEYQVNDTLDQWSLIQNLFLRFDKNVQIDFGLWLQDKSKDIPPVMGSYQASYASQEDRSLKGYVKLKKLFSTSRILLQVGYLNDSLHYTKVNGGNQKDLLIDSHIHTQSIFSKAEWRWFISRDLTIDLGAHSEHPSAMVDAYGSGKQENRYSLITAAKYRKKGWIVNLGIRKEFNPFNPPKPLASAGLSWKSVNQQILFRGNVSNKFRIPTFNERYWEPGGNPDLSPESGWGGEFAWKWSNHSGEAFDQEIETVLFYQKIWDWIQWIPTSGYWHPVNQDLLISKGVELNGKSAIEWHGWEANLIYKYSYTNSSRAQEDNLKELNPVVYIPKHQGLIGLNLKIRGITLGCNYQILGKRFTTSDMNPIYALDPIHLINFNSAYKYRFRNMHMEIYARINNLGNQHYQMIRAYASPGISGSVGMKLNFLN